MLEEMKEAKGVASKKRKESCKSGDVERREGIANCRMDRELAKMMTALTAQEQLLIFCQSTCFFKNSTYSDIFINAFFS